MTPVSTRVVSAVAEDKSVGCTSLPPLYDAIDPDALDALFDGRTDAGHTRRTFEVTFSYADRVVRVLDGDISVGTPDDPPA